MYVKGDGYSGTNMRHDALVGDMEHDSFICDTHDSFIGDTHESGTCRC